MFLWNSILLEGDSVLKFLWSVRERHFPHFFSWSMLIGNTLPPLLLLASRRKNSSSRKPGVGEGGIVFVFRKVKCYVWWINLKPLTRHAWLSSAFLPLGKSCLLQTHILLLLQECCLFGWWPGPISQGLLATWGKGLWALGCQQTSCCRIICSLSVTKAVC